MKPPRQIDVAGPDITQHEIDAVTRAMKHGWYEKPYYYVEKFQDEFSQYHHRKFGIMTPSCTTAIHLLLSCLGIERGDEVIVPECTWIASSAPISYLGATPVFCDIDRSNWCASPESIEKNITNKTKAIIVVDLFGNMPAMEQISDISRKYNIPLIEDAAEALGSSYTGIPAGKFGVGSVFSFHRTKTLTTGEGGMLLLGDEELYKKCMIWRDHGRDGALPLSMQNPNQKAYYSQHVTFKYMPSNLQAALGYAQFQRIDELVQRKRHHLHFYRNELNEMGDLYFNEDSNLVYNGAWVTAMIIGNSYSIDKEIFIDEMKKEGIPIRPFFYPLSSLPAYNMKTNMLKNPISYDISNRGVNLPGSARLTDDDLLFICNKVKKVLRYKGGRK